MALKLTGGCLCGAVRYQATADGPLCLHCYCKDCQRATGSAFATIVAVPKDRFELSGAMGSYRTPGASGKHVERFFCTTCGSQVYSVAEVMSQAIFVKAGTLDDASQIQPQMAVWTSSAPAWARLAGEIPTFARNPET